MVKLLQSNGAVKDIKPKSGGIFSLKELQDFVGGYIELVYLEDNLIMIVNEEGKLLNLPINEKATDLVIGVNKMIEIIVGNVVVCPKNMLK